MKVAIDIAAPPAKVYIRAAPLSHSLHLRCLMFSSLLQPDSKRVGLSIWHGSSWLFPTSSVSSPHGVTASFVNPPSISCQITAFSPTFSGAATLFVVLRLYARAYILRVLGLDDREFHTFSFGKVN
jgi:hypothetical protein